MGDRRPASFVVVGELDLYSCAQLRGPLVRTLRQVHTGRGVVIDVRRVGFCGVAGAHLLHEVTARARDAGVILTVAAGRAVCRTARLCEVHPDAMSGVQGVRWECACA